MQPDPWIFNYRSYICNDSDSDSDYSFHGSKPNTSDEARLKSELDISTRLDAAVFKPNPFSIAKMNAFTRSSRPTVANATQVAENPKITGTVDAFFGKTARKKPAACKGPLIPGDRDIIARSQAISTNDRVTERLPSKTPESCTDRYPNSSNRSKLNVAEMLSNRPHQADKNLTCHNPDIQRVNMPHIVAPVYVQEEPSMLVYAKTAPLPPQDTCSRHQVTVYSTRPGKENRPVVPREDHPHVSPSDKKESPLLSISYKERRPVPFKPNHVSGVTSASSPRAIARSRYAPAKRPVKSSKVNSLAQMYASTARNKAKCYEVKSNEDESWSTLPPRKKLKPSVQPVSKYKMTRPFCIPGLSPNGEGVKTGMSATSTSRVITFLPTPLVSDSRKSSSKARLETQSSPRSSPQSHHYFDFTDNSGGTPYTSPPTSDSPEADCDLNIRWDTHQLKERYAQVPKAIEEHRRSKQLIWNLLGLDSNGYVYRDDEDVQTDVRIVVWRG